MGANRWRVTESPDCRRFIRLVARDLCAGGVHAEVTHGGGATYFTLDALQGGRPTIDPRAARTIQPHESTRELLRGSTMPGRDLKVDAIDPEVTIVESTQDATLFDACRQSASVVSNRRIGRQVKAIIRDRGNGHAVMGVIGLASSPYTLGCRDRLLDWTSSSKRRADGLRQSMDLACCVPLPPYSHLGTSKLLAALALSDSLEGAFERRYGQILRAVIGTSALGLHAPMLNRIMLVRGGLYRRIGETTGYTTSWASPELLASARSVIRLSDTRLVERRESNGMRSMREALITSGVPYRRVLVVGPVKGVYLGASSKDDVEALRTGNVSMKHVPLVASTAVEYWRTEVLPRRMARDHVRRRLREFVPDRHWRLAG